MKQVTGVRRFLGVLCCIVGTSVLAAPGGTGSRGGGNQRADEARAWRGSEAIERLGSRLAALAQRHGMEISALRRRFSQDRTLWVDLHDELLYADDFELDAEAAAEAEANGSDPFVSLPLEQTFLLHSNPSASRVIYLDFNGHVTSGTYWNSAYTGGADLVTAPFSLDGDPSAFSDSELLAIQQIFLRVAEDFRPFDVNVTTEEPPAAALVRSDPADTAYGIRVVVTPTSDWLGMSAGGICYVGSFAWNSDTPCFVFSSALGNNSRYIGEAASHETGHSLGLHHDGLTNGTVYYGGHADWAPIMGLSYYKAMTHWSRGDYLNADNQEDDLQVMASYGIAFRADDHGDTLATATAFDGGSVDLTGMITRATDVDVFTFTAAAGDVSLQVAPTAYAPNLNVRASLYDHAGSLLVTADDPTGLAASIEVSVSTGTYYLAVDGVGSGDATTGYTDYGSLGAYRISGTVPENVALQAPQAVASATPSSGMAPLSVMFDGSGSWDADGDIAAYYWEFGDGAASTESSPNHVYQSAGQFTASLTVTDNDGLNGSASVTIQVDPAPNQEPVALISATPVSGVAPLQVSFSAADSYDPDGTIVAYSWDFGTGTRSTHPTPTYTYQFPGTYTASVLVADDRGGQDIAAVTIEVVPDPSLSVHVADIAMSLSSAKSGTAAVAEVLIVDGFGNPMGNAQVTGSWSGLVKGSGTESTLSDGTATFTSGKSRKVGEYIFTVMDVIAAGYTYEPSQNLETSDAIGTGASENVKPKAVAAASATVVEPGTPITFDASGSSDPDGHIVSYAWTLGDGTVATGPTVAYAYEAEGGYSATLTVTDDQGASDSAQVSITVNSNGVVTIAVADIAMSLLAHKGGDTALADVRIADLDGNAVSGATVTGRWDGPSSETVTAVTDAAGVAAFAAKKQRGSFTYTFTVESVHAAGAVYDPAQNTETSDSVSN